MDTWLADRSAALVVLFSAGVDGVGAGGEGDSRYRAHRGAHEARHREGFPSHE